MDVISPLLELIDSLLRDEDAMIHGISDKLQTWQRVLPKIQDVMDSAEEKLMDGDPAVHRWLDDLRDVAYDMEDLLEHFSVEAKRGDLEVQDQSRPTKLPRLQTAWVSSRFSRHRLANEIEKVDQRLEEVLQRRKSILNLEENPRRRTHNDQPRFPTTSLTEPKFVGREKQMEELLARLTGSAATNESDQPFTVVSIVGMGGLGKTTLAQELYHKAAAFDAKAWVCVSDVFDMVAITKSILDQVAQSSSSGVIKDLKQLQNLLRVTLSGKKFLIVLDDVWNEKYDELQFLFRPLLSGSKGSRILLTTRNVKVAQSAGDKNSVRLDLMSSEESLNLLAYHSLREENFLRHPHLKDIADQLVEKCKGLPLYIKTIGGLLRCLSVEEWKEVLADNIWEGKEGQGKILPALKLSYVHLPIELKRCFKACALLPKDYEFDQDEVIQLWNTQGLLNKGTARTFREVGMKYIRQLVDVSLFQKVRDEKTLYSMHNLINDLAKSLVVGSYEDKEGSSPGKESRVRHASMVTEYYDYCVSKRFDAYRSMKKLRTFIHFSISADPRLRVYVSDEVIRDLIMDMKNLRMLSMRYFLVTEVPDMIGELKLLRSVDFSYTMIEVLPESICDLVELRTLLLRGCSKLMKLPRNIHKLTNLLHLDIIGTNELMEMPPDIGNLINLEILSSFVVGKHVGQELKQLGPLKCLQRELQVRNLLDVDDVEDARSANLSEKEAILILSFDWGSSSETSREGDHQLSLLDRLKPPRKIEILTIHNYGGKQFPSWIVNACMNHIVSINLTDCKSVESLPPFGGLPSLEELVIKGLKAVSSIGAEFYGTERWPFRSLRSLRFDDMGAWEKWSSHGDGENELSFPCLRELEMRNCPKLNGGGTISLPSLVTIDIGGCNEGMLKCLVCLSSMTKMKISKIPQLVHFAGSFSNSWVALEEMSIQECPQFKSFVDGDCGQQLPPKLKELTISGCGALEELPDDLSGLASLNEISVTNCEKLSSLPSTGLPSALRRLKLESCPSLPQSQLIISCRYLESIEELILFDLEGLVSFMDLAAEGTPLSRSLRNLEVFYCRSLATMPDSLEHLSSLSKLSLSICPALEMDSFPALPCNLSRFELARCPKVKSLPHDMHDLAPLKELSIINCEDIMRLPRGGLPPNLESLRIMECDKLNQPIEEWGLRGLTALRKLVIGGEMECMDEMECFPPPSTYRTTSDVEAWRHLLPSSLVSLSFAKMKKLERIGSGLRAHLPSLRRLNFFGCERMRWLPNEGLPDSLEQLWITKCPALGKKCSKKPEGDYWPHLRLIPNLQIIEEMSDDRALHLFSRHAFGGDDPSPDYMYLSKELVKLTGNIPSALVELGTNLHGCSISSWEETLEKLKHEFHLRQGDTTRTTKISAAESFLERPYEISVPEKAKEGDKISVPEKAKEGDKTQLAAINHIIDIDHQVSGLIEFVNRDSNGVSMIGIHATTKTGHGSSLRGVGSTTLAKAVYSRVSSQFDACCFLEDITEAIAQPGGIRPLQFKLIHDILRVEYKDDTSYKEAFDVFKEVLRHMKVLIVFDGVEDISGITNFIGNGLKNCLGLGSWIIVTTRGSNVITDLGVDLVIYKSVNLMETKVAVELFNWHAFGKEYCKTECSEFVEPIVSKLLGCPLLIEFAGSLLRGKTVQAFEQLYTLIRPLNGDFWDILAVLHGELNELQRQIFLDVACFASNEDVHTAKYMWHECLRWYWGKIMMPFAKVGADDRLRMHSSLRHFGRQLQREDKENSGISSYVFDHQKALDKIKNERETARIEALCLDFNGQTSTEFTDSNFRKMSQLKFLRLDSAVITGDFSGVFPKLRWLQWRRCPNNFEATNVDTEGLLILDLSGSAVTEDWEGWGNINLMNVKVLNLSGCVDLLLTPNFKESPELERLILEGCPRLVHIGPSIGTLKRLVYLNLKSCRDLNILPRELGELVALRELLIDGTGVEAIPDIGELINLEILSCLGCFSLRCLPDSVGKLKRLQKLSIRDCQRVRHLPEPIGEVGGSLVELDISGTGIAKLEDSISNLQSLKVLRMDSCFMRQLPSTIKHLTNLEELHASRCRNLKEIPSEIGYLKKLRTLELRYASISGLPMEVGKLDKLEMLDISHCDKLKQPPPLPSKVVCIWSEN